MKQKDIEFVAREIKNRLANFTDKIVAANSGTTTWQEIKTIVANVCDKKGWVYVNRNDLTNAAIQMLRREIKESGQEIKLDMDKIRSGAEKSLPEEIGDISKEELLRLSGGESGIEPEPNSELHFR